jgi:pentapeptide repeat protein
MAETGTYPQTAPEKEKWLLEGRPIEFPTSAPGGMTSEEWKSLRTIPADLLWSVFDKVTRVCNLRVKLRNVILVGNVRLAYRSSTFEFAIVDSDFQDLADFSFFGFDGATDFTLSRFHKEAKFNSSRFKYDLRLNEAVFEKEASFQAIEIQGRMFSLGTRFQNANFANAKFAKSAPPEPFRSLPPLPPTFFLEQLSDLSCSFLYRRASQFVAH